MNLRCSLGNDVADFGDVFEVDLFWLEVWLGFAHFALLSSWCLARDTSSKETEWLTFPLLEYLMQLIRNWNCSSTVTVGAMVMVGRNWVGEFR